MDLQNLSAYQQPPQAPAPIIPKKSKLPLVLGVALLVLAVGTMGYFAATKKYGVAQVSPTPSTPNTESWKTCATALYSFKYPSEWQIFEYGPYEVAISCADSISLIFAPSIGDKGINSFSVDVETPERLKGTVYAGATTLEQYFQKNPAILKASSIVKESILDGERLVELADSRFMAAHNSNFYTFRVSGTISKETAHQILSTFKFTK